MPHTSSLFTSDRFRHFAIIAGLITLIRVIVLFNSDINLGPDETQYWFWGQTPAFGYFSKPPMIAWVIGAATTLFGDAEWAVRIAAPFFHLATAAFLFALTRRLYGQTPAFWAGLVWITLPGVSLSSMVISTDALLLFFWAAALYFFFRLAAPEKTETRPALSALFLGAAMGFGFMSKYAMIYFLPGAAAALIFSAAQLRWRDGAIAGAAALAIMAPNIIWNANHGFQTVSHTAANANWGGSLFHPIALLEFIIAQFGVFGPLTFGLVIAGFLTLKPRLQKAAGMQWADRALIAFIAPPLLIVSMQAFISRAHANWGAAAFPAAAILIVIWAHRANKNNILKAGIALNMAVAAVAMVAIVNFSFADRLGLSGVIKRVRGWEAQSTVIAKMSTGYDAIMADDRELIGGILYYGRQSKIPVIAWNSNFHIDHHYEAFHAFNAQRHQKILYVSAHPGAIAVQNRFATITALGETTADLKRGHYRRLYLFELAGYKSVSGNLLDESSRF